MTAASCRRQLRTGPYQPAGGIRVTARRSRRQMSASDQTRVLARRDTSGLALLDPSPPGPTTLDEQLPQPRDGGVGSIGERVHQADERLVRHVLVLPVQLPAGRRLLEQLAHQVGRLAQELLVRPVLCDPTDELVETDDLRVGQL